MLYLIDSKYSLLLRFFFAGVSVVLYSCQSTSKERIVQRKPNVVFVLADEWRGQDTGYMGNEDIVTPNLDKLASESVNVTNAISGVPVCSPYRASFLTGQYPLSNGVFVNDVLLNPESNSIAKVFKSEGYETAYIGKWHLDGHGRSNFIEKDRRQGFEYWKVLECTHEYYNSTYWDNNDKQQKWEGYDAFAQTADAVSYIKDRKESDKPFFLVLSWGPPHTPFDLAPEKYRKIYKDKNLTVRPNVPEERIAETKEDLKGYYGHISALDKSIGDLQKAIASAGLEENTIFIFTSDHGNMINSHAKYFKQKPYEESILVPFLLKYPAKTGKEGYATDMLLNAPDIMPTLLGLCDIDIPRSVEGDNLSAILLGKQEDTTEAVLLSCPHPFGQWAMLRGGKEYRGVRTKRYTYVMDLEGPWLLFDNKKDPYQMTNVINENRYQPVREALQVQLEKLLVKTNDQFLPGMEYIKKWGYTVDKNGTIPYRKVNYKGVPISRYEKTN